MTPRERLQRPWWRSPFLYLGFVIGAIIPWLVTYCG